MARQEMRIRGGAIDYGRIYEQRIAAYLAIKCALDPEVSDFWMVSNIEGFGQFDDIILMVQGRDTNKKLYCIQLKHLVHSVLQATQLESNSIRFNLKKYQDSFDLIEDNISGNKTEVLKNISWDEIHLILWTNAPLTGREKLQNINAESVGGMDFLNTSSDSNIYKIRNLPSSETPFNEKFLEKFYLFVDQASAPAMDKMIKDNILSHFNDISNTVIITITDYFARWSMGNNRNIQRITKSDVQIKLLEFLLFPYLIEPNITEDLDPAKCDLINYTLKSFNIIPITETRLLKNIFSSSKFVLDRLCHSCLDLFLPWNTDLHQTQWYTINSIHGKDIENVQRILREKKNLIPYLTIRDIYLAAWQCRLIPLIINCNVSENLIEKILVKLEEVTKNLSFVLLNPVISLLNGNLKIFNSINNLENIQLKNRNLDQTFVSLQGKEKINLERFKEDNQVLETVTPDVYLILMNGAIELGKKVEVENYYVQRYLRRPQLKLSVLDGNSILTDRESMFNQIRDVFLLVEYEEKSLPLRYEEKSMELAKYLREECYKRDDVYILLTHLTDQDQEVIWAITQLRKKTTKSVHVVKMKNNCLEWSLSKGSIETLQKHLLGSNLLKNENSEYNIREADILNCSKSAINIISNNTGMGKTFFLKSIANKFKPDEWVCYVNLSEQMMKVPQECSYRTFFNYISKDNLKTEHSCTQELCAKVYDNCLQTGKIICLFDGFDKVPSDHVLSLLEDAKKLLLRMWITTTPTHKRALEIQMENLSVELTHFSTEDHVTFLCNYFHSYRHIYQYDDAQIQYIIDTINKCFSNLGKTFKPVQTLKFAEIFGDE